MSVNISQFYLFLTTLWFAADKPLIMLWMDQYIAGFIAGYT